MKIKNAVVAGMFRPLRSFVVRAACFTIIASVPSLVQAGTGSVTIDRSQFSFASLLATGSISNVWENGSAFVELDGVGNAVGTDVSLTGPDNSGSAYWNSSTLSATADAVFGERATSIARTSLFGTIAAGSSLEFTIPYVMTVSSYGSDLDNGYASITLMSETANSYASNDWDLQDRVSLDFYVGPSQPISNSFENVLHLSLSNQKLSPQTFHIYAQLNVYSFGQPFPTVTNPIPEPETYAMMLAGLGLLGVMARRRKQKLVAQ